MAEVYNYQKALKQDIVIRKISDEYSLPVALKIYLVNMAEVYNYQKALKQDIVIRKISDEYSLPVDSRAILSRLTVFF